MYKPKPVHNPYRHQEKEEMIRLGYKTRKAYLKAMKKERIRSRNELHGKVETENS
jgi:hypothetical protein